MRNSPNSDTAPKRTTVLDGLYLKPGWHQLKVDTTGGNAIVSGLARFVDHRRSDLRIRLEAAGETRFVKTLKTAEMLTSLSISLEGPRTTQLSNVDIRRLRGFEIAAFLIGKGIRYLMAGRRHRTWRSIFSHVRAAFQSDGSFAFRGQYDGRDNNTLYPRWQTIHEDANAGQRATAILREHLGSRVLRIALILPDALDARKIAMIAKDSLLGSQIAVMAIHLSGIGEEPAWDFALPLDYSGVFRNGALERMVLAFFENPEIEGVFADSDELAPDGSRKAPRLKPGWDRELLWSTDYIRAPLLVRWRPDLPGAFAIAGASRRPGYALALYLLENRQRSDLMHLPEILFHEDTILNRGMTPTHQEILQAHIHAGGLNNEVSLRDDGILHVDWALPVRLPRVSIIIPSRDNPGLLTQCIRSIRGQLATLTPEIIVADNDSATSEMLSLLDDLAKRGEARVVRCPGEFNFAKINNDARRYATGDVLVFLNDDTRVLADNWLTELVGLAIRPGIGAVGPLLLYPDGTVQHAGVLLGVGSVADHAFRHASGDSRGYLDLLLCRREVTAITGACLAVTSETFDAVNGFDESLAVTLNDVDFCLRVRDHGKINVWTPWAVLEHLEGMSRGVDFTKCALTRQAAEVRIFSERWAGLIDRDPTYHPGLSTLAPDYRLSV